MRPEPLATDYTIAKPATIVHGHDGTTFPFRSAAGAHCLISQGVGAGGEAVPCLGARERRSRAEPAARNRSWHHRAIPNFGSILI